LSTSEKSAASYRYRTFALSSIGELNWHAMHSIGYAIDWAETHCAFVWLKPFDCADNGTNKQLSFSSKSHCV
jgi:hypothetical protein